MSESCSLVDLGGDPLSHVLVSLSHVEWARLACVSRVFRAAVGDVRASCTHADASALQLNTILRSRTLGESVLNCVRGLRSLGLRGQDGIDDVQLGSLTVLQQLHSLDIASTEVTSRGLRNLWSLQSLRELDLTFCPTVSYSAVLQLRRHCPNLRLIRRQPEWLDGHFETPWGEVHTYYPCGAFSFSREVESEGWTAQLRDRGGYLEDRLIFVDIGNQVDLAHRYNGRVGVLLKNLDCTPGEARRVLVVQSHFHPEPPPALPLIPAPPAPGHTNDYHAEGFMASTMVVRQLEAGCTQPPADVQARLRRFCEERVPGEGGAGSLLRRVVEGGALVSIRSPVVQSVLPFHGDDVLAGEYVESDWLRLAQVIDALVDDQSGLDAP